MTSSDTAGIALIESSVFSDPWSAGDFSDMLASPHHSVICASNGSGDVLGYAAASFVAGESELLRIAVSQDSRRRGIGLTLLRAIIDERRRANDEVIFLEVRSRNTPAVSLYTSAGFSAYATRKGYYKAPADDALMMSLPLK